MKSKLKTGIWAIFAIALGVSFVSFVFTEAGYFRVPKENIGNSRASVEGGLEEEKKYFFIKNLKEKPRVSALSYLVGDLTTGEVILFKDKDKALPIASISKLMTALVAKENIASEENIVITESALNTYGENGNFRKGENIPLSEILYPLLLESSNDAGVAIAEHLGKETFIEKMNDKAESLGMTSTSFKDPTGLSPENTSSTFDLFKLAKFIKDKNQELLDISTSRSYFNQKHSWSNNNRLIKELGYLGGKTGFIDESGETIVSIFSLPLEEEASRPVAIVLLKSNDRYSDVKNILSYLKKNIYYGSDHDAELAWVKQKEGIPEEKDPDFLTLSFLGDIMLDRGVKNSVIKNFAGDYAKLFENMSVLQKSDIVFANLEGPAGLKGKDLGNLYSFRMDPTVIPALKGAGFDVLSVANNHVGDWGRIAFEETLARLDENEILYTGGGTNKFDAEKPRIIEKYGMKIGFLGFSDVGPNWMQAKNILEEGSAGILLASDPRFEEIIKNAKSQVDFLIVSFHFGDEYKLVHNQRQEYLAHKAVDAGAKLVIGHHPHVVEDTEVYKDGFIAYSLGNFIFDQYFSPETMKGMLLDVKLWRDGNIDVVKNTVNLNRAFYPESITKGKEEKIILNKIN